MKKLLFFTLLLVLLFSTTVFAVPANGEVFEFEQPDGTTISARAFGDEFYLRVESLDGYTLMRDPDTWFLCYAKLSSDGSDFESTGIVYSNSSRTTDSSSQLLPPKGLELGEEHVKRITQDTKELLLGAAALINDSERTTIIMVQKTRVLNRRIHLKNYGYWVLKYTKSEIIKI